MFGCGGRRGDPGSMVKGGSLLEGILRLRLNRLHDEIRLLRAALSSQNCRGVLVDLERDVVYGGGSSRTFPSPFVRKQDYVARRASRLR